MPRPSEPDTVPGPQPIPATAGDRDHSAAERVHAHGRTLVSEFYKVAKTTGMFGFENVVSREAIEGFLSTVRLLLRSDDALTLQVASDCIFVNESRLKVDFQGFAAFRYVIEAFKARGIGAIVFTGVPDEQSLCTFLALYSGNEDPDAGRGRIEAGLVAARVDGIYVLEPRDLADQETSDDVPDAMREVSVNTYFKGIYVARQVMSSFGGGRPANMRRARRLVHSIVDIITSDESTLLALTQIKNYDDCLFTHSANVCVLSVALGQGLGLDKELLSNLGLAGLLHDIGMVELGKRAGDGAPSREVSDEEFLRRHPVIGARRILKGQGVTDSGIRCAMVAYEHHLRQDGSGHPAGSEGRDLSLLGRIVAVTDFYDTITTPNEDGKPTFTPEEALRLMGNEGGEVLSSLLVKAFVNTVGIYPLGTVVKLDTHEVGIVHRKPTNLRDLSRPVVKIIQDTRGRSVSARIVDLNEKDRERQRYKRTIIEAIPAYAFFEDLQTFTKLL